MRVLPVILLSLCGCFSATAESAAPASASPSTQAERRETQTLRGMLSDPDRSTRTRTEAAELLLAKGHADAIRALTDAIGGGGDRASAVAVARAIAKTTVTDDAFITPLLSMLSADDAEIRSAAAAALGAYRNAAVLDRLNKMALHSGQSLPARLAAIAALTRRVEKQSIDTLISLLAAPEPQLRSAAADALQTLTGIRRFEADAGQWSQWWRANKNKPRQQWLADQVDSLTRLNASQQQQIGDLLTRLSRAMNQLYTTTPAAARATMVLGLMKDPVAEVRLIGLALANQRIGAGEALAAQTQPVVRALLADEHPAVRASAAKLAANLGDAEAVDVLMARLRLETNHETRKDLITALGSLGDGRALDVLLTALADPNAGAAAEAAVAVERLAATTALGAEQIERAVAVITERYDAERDARADLRRALLGIMRVLNRQEFAPVMRSALTDKVAMIRLEAIRGLEHLNHIEAGDQIAKLTSDGDRGVRQAAIDSLAALGGPEHLKLVLKRTAEAVESDPAVRLQAWNVALRLLERSEADQLARTASGLTDRPDALPYRIRILQMLIDRLDETNGERTETQLLLAEALLTAGRPAEAAEVFAAAHDAAATGAETSKVWLRWMNALLAADDAASLTHMAAQGDPALFTSAVNLLTDRLTALQTAGQYQPLIALADLAATRLGEKLSAASLAVIDAMRADAVSRQQLADRSRVVKLVASLANGDAAQRGEAEAALLALQRRAVPPLVEMLATVVADDTANPARAADIIGCLAKLAPDLTGYDPAAPADQKLKLIEAWMEILSPKSAEVGSNQK